MSFLYLFLVGILIGSASVIPGVSGAVIAIIFNLYEKSIDALVNLFKDFKNNIIFLIVVGFGVLLGAIWFGNILLFLYEKHETIVKFSFIGLILGGVPNLFSQVNSRGKKINIIVLLITILFSFILLILTSNVISAKTNLNFINLFIGGFIYSIGKVIPGISGSFLMILLGMYEFVLQVISHPITYGLLNIGKVIPFSMGLIIGVLILINLVNKLFNKYFSLMYSIIIGLVIGSISVLIPAMLTIKILLIGIVVMIFSFLLSYMLLKST